MQAKSKLKTQLKLHCLELKQTNKQRKHKTHIEELRIKTTYKIHVLRKIRKYPTVKKAS